MYLRQLKQYLRNVDGTFDERKFGFESLGDLMRACHREGVLRIERDRQGGMRIFPGNLAPAAAAPFVAEDLESSEAAPMPDAQPVLESIESFDSGWVPPAETPPAAEVVEGAVVQEMDEPSIIDAEEAPAPVEKAPRRRPRATKNAEPRATRKSGDASKTRKAAAKPRATRSRARAETSQD
jgi:hypothetical protein